MGLFIDPNSQSELDSEEMSHRFRFLKKELLLSFNEEFRHELLRQVEIILSSFYLSFTFYLCFLLFTFLSVCGGETVGDDRQASQRLSRERET